LNNHRKSHAVVLFWAKPLLGFIFQIQLFWAFQMNSTQNSPNRPWFLPPPARMFFTLPAGINYHPTVTILPKIWSCVVELPTTSFMHVQCISNWKVKSKSDCCDSFLAITVGTRIFGLKDGFGANQKQVSKFSSSSREMGPLPKWLRWNIRYAAKITWNLWCMIDF